MADVWVWLVAIIGATDARLPLSRLSSRERTPSMAFLSVSFPVLAEMIRLRRQSTESSKRLITRRSGRERPSRSASSRDSSTCANAATSSKPKVLLPPLMEWAARKMVLRISGSAATVSWPLLAAAFSRRSNSVSMPASPSRLSSKKVWWNWRISMAMVLSQDFFDHVQQLFRIERFDDPAGGAGDFTLLPFGFLRLRGEHENRREFVVRLLTQ